MIDYKIIGKRIQSARKAKGLTQEKLAQEVLISVVYLSKIENGRVFPTLELLSTISQALNVDLGTLISGSETEDNRYENEKVVSLFNACRPQIKPIALNLLEELSKIN